MSCSRRSFLLGGGLTAAGLLGSSFGNSARVEATPIGALGGDSILIDENPRSCRPKDPLATLIEDLDQRGMLDETLVVAVGEFGRSPRKGLSTSGNDNDADGRDHWPYCFTAVVAGAGVKRGHVHGQSDETGSAPVEAPVHPNDLLATMYHALGIEPHTMVMNHLNQPRELVQGSAVLDLFA